MFFNFFFRFSVQMLGKKTNYFKKFYKFKKFGKNEKKSMVFLQKSDKKSKLRKK